MGAISIGSAARRLDKFAALLIFSVFITACISPGGTPTVDAQGGQESTEVKTTEVASLPPTEVASLPPTVEPTTESPSPPIGKLLDPCGLIPPPAEVEAFLGEPIIGHTLFSTWVPDNRQGLGNELTLARGLAPSAAPILAERMLYECSYDVEGFNNTWISVEVFAEPSDALAQMESTLELYNANLRLETVEPQNGTLREGLEPMVELSGLGDRAYGFEPTISISSSGREFGHPARVYPTIYFLSGNYLVRIGNPSDDFEWALEAAQNALSRLPADIHSIIAEQDLRLDMANQPAGKLLEPCELVTRDEAQLFSIEAPIAVEQSYAFWPGSQDYNCSYGEAGSYVEIMVAYYQDIEYISSYVEANSISEVNGFGDRAFRGLDSYSFATGTVVSADIVVFSGNYLMSILINNSSDEEAQFQSAFELAALALSRLP